MKKQFFLVFTLFMIAMAIVSCSQEQVNSEPIYDQNDPDAIIAQAMEEIKNSGKEYTIEHATWDEINAAMRENGIPEYTKEEMEEIENKAITRTVYDCSLWVYYGDWTGNGVLNVSDMVQARNYWICLYAYHPTDQCLGSVHTITCEGSLGDAICPPNEGKRFSFLTFLESGADPFYINQADVDAAAQRILAITPCNP